MKSSNDRERYGVRIPLRPRDSVDGCVPLYNGLEKRGNLPRGGLLKPQKGLESELSAFSFRHDAIQVSWKVSPNGTAGIFSKHEFTPHQDGH